MVVEIVHIASELAPVAKVGGLADVLHGLSRALLAKGHSVEVVLPKYDTLNLNLIQHLEVALQTGTFTLWKGLLNTIPVSLIESHDPNAFFDRGTVYGCEDDVKRFSFFCRCALAYLKAAHKTPDVVHIHDWHTALMAPLLKKDEAFQTTPVLFTIHNFAYQGICHADDIGWELKELEDPNNPNVYNLMKGGIVFADHVTTVSPNYAQELLNTEMGGGLRPILNQYASKFSGVLNGIDYDYWNPETDPYLPTHFSAKNREGKAQVKKETRARLGLADEGVPLVCAVMRLVPQKGPELIKAALLRTLEQGGQFLLLGSALDEETHAKFYNLKRKFAGSHHVHLELTYNEELAHLVFAASDLFLVPSIFEPCGLTQLIAMRYGTVPLVRETGGLVDTVFEGKNGFTFAPPTAEAINATLDRALVCYREKPAEWERLQKGGMERNYSWDVPAENYLKIYQKLRVLV